MVPYHSQLSRTLYTSWLWQLPRLSLFSMIGIVLMCECTQNIEFIAFIPYLVQYWRKSALFLSQTKTFYLWSRSPPSVKLHSDHFAFWINEDSVAVIKYHYEKQLKGEWLGIMGPEGKVVIVSGNGWRQNQEAERTHLSHTGRRRSIRNVEHSYKPSDSSQGCSSSSKTPCPKGSRISTNGVPSWGPSWHEPMEVCLSHLGHSNFCLWLCLKMLRQGCSRVQ